MTVGKAFAFAAGVAIGAVGAVVAALVLIGDEDDPPSSVIVKGG